MNNFNRDVILYYILISNWDLMTLRYLLAIFLCVSTFASQKKVLEFLTLDYCPLICKSGDRKGILVDILETIYVPLGYKINVNIKPIKRAFKDYANGEYDGVIGGDPTQFPLNSFPKIVSVPHSPYFYKLANNKWEYNGIESLKLVRIGAVENYKYANPDIEKYLRSKNDGVVLISEKDHLKKLINLLKKNRIDSFLGGEFPVEDYLKSKGLEKEIILASKDIGTFRNYISFSNKSKNSKELLEIHDKRFMEIYKDGTLAKIYQKYGVRTAPRLIKR